MIRAATQQTEVLGRSFASLKFRRWLPVSLVIASSGLLLVAWACVVPIFESPDENHHWKNVQYVHSHLALPPYNPDYLEGAQAPLYYVLLSPLASSSAVPPVLDCVENEKYLGFSLKPMPHVEVNAPCPPHFFRNCPGDLNRYWPIREVRLATCVLSLVALTFTALAVWEATKSISLSAMGAALMGFLPQFTFRGATVNNDAAVICFAAVTTYLIVRMRTRGFERLSALCGAVALALAFLSKINAAVLVPVFIACILLTAPSWQRRAQRLLFLLISAMLVLPWLIRNKISYGDFLASNAILRMVPTMVTRRSIRDPYFYTEFLKLTSKSFVGLFGWMNLGLPAYIYKGYALLLVIAIAGLICAVLLRRVDLRLVVLLASLPILSAAFLIFAALTFPQPQGRILFPSLSAITILAAISLGAIERTRKYVAIAVTFMCLTVNVFALTRVVYPAYWRHGQSCWVCP